MLGRTDFYWDNVLQRWVNVADPMGGSPPILYLSGSPAGVPMYDADYVLFNQGGSIVKMTIAALLALVGLTPGVVTNRILTRSGAFIRLRNGAYLNHR